MLQYPPFPFLRRTDDRESRGPDFLLAPAGFVSDDGIRPWYQLERVLGEILTPDAPWLRDRKEGLAADAPLAVKVGKIIVENFQRRKIQR